jgi:hypothetical protein
LPSPWRTGAESGTLTEILFEALCEADGTALSNPYVPSASTGASFYPTGPQILSYNQAEHLAEARCLAYLWGLNEKLANQFDMSTVTHFLSRWEAIYQIVPPAGATDDQRRLALQARLASWGLPGTQQVLTDLLTTLLGSSFVPPLLYVTSAQCVQQTVGVPCAASVDVGASITIPGNINYLETPPTVVSGGTIPYVPGSGPNPGCFGSAVANLGILCQQVAPQTLQAFRALLGQAWWFLDRICPCWGTFTFFEQVGIHLDVPANLDTTVFDL